MLDPIHSALLNHILATHQQVTAQIETLVKLTANSTNPEASLRVMLITGVVLITGVMLIIRGGVNHQGWC